MSVLEDVCFSSFELLLFRAAFSVTLFGALRVGEFTAPNKSSSSFLLFSHVSMQPDGLRLFLCRSKTFGLGNGKWISLASSPNLLLCPVAHMANYIAVRPCFDGSFFIHQDLSPLTRYQFSAVLSSCIKRLNLAGLNFSSHSFRIGAATMANLLGFPPESQKRVGRWVSNRYKLYVRPELLIV